MLLESVCAGEAAHHPSGLSSHGNVGLVLLNSTHIHASWPGRSAVSPSMMSVAQ